MGVRGAFVRECVLWIEAKTVRDRAAQGPRLQALRGLLNGDVGVAITPNLGAATLKP